MLDDEDGLDELLEHSDPNSPHHFEHYLYFPLDGAGVQVAAMLRQRGFEVESRESADGSQWLVLAKHRVMPKVDVIRSVRTELAELATKHGGEYDGWEGEVVKVTQ